MSSQSTKFAQAESAVTHTCARNGRNARRLAAAAAIGTAAVLVAAPAAAADGAPVDGETATVYGDVDGDGHGGPITLREVGENTQSLRFSFDDQTYATTFEADTRAPLQEPRVVDIDSDGTDEVMAVKFVGANTLTMTIWKYVPGEGIVEMTDTSGAPFEVYEGGSASAVSGYECTADHDAGQFVTLLAQQDVPSPGEEPHYTGTRITHSVDGTTVSEESVVPVEGTDISAPPLKTDPATCAS